MNPDRIGLTKKVTVGIVGDCCQSCNCITAKLADSAGDAGRADRKNLIAQTKSAWAQELTSMTEEQDDPGTDWNVRARAPSLTGWPHAWHGAQSRRLCRLRRSSRPTSATTARSVTPIRPSTRAASIWHLACLAHVATACLHRWRENRSP